MPSSSSDRVGWCPHKKPKYSPEMRRSIVNSPTSNRWTVTLCLGKYTHHSVYLAQSRIDKDEEEDELPFEIVIKSSEMLQAYQLKNEEKFLSRLKSPFVVSFYGHETSLKKDEKDPFKWNVIYNTIHEYGRSLANHVKRHEGKIPEDDARRFACDILFGLKYIHGEKIIHCNIKPENILLAHEDNKSISSSDGFVAKISGFLLAIEKGSVEYGDGLGHKRGSIRYLSPEELRGDMVLDYSADVWAYGCTVFEMLTGECVWKEYGKLRWEGMVSLIGESDVVPHIPDDLSEKAKDFLSKCLERDPAKRWSVDTLLEHQFLKWIDEEVEDEEQEQEEDVEAYAANLEFEEAFQEEEEAEEGEEAFEEEEAEQVQEQ